MQDKEKFISDKIAILIKEGYKKPQAYMIAKSMFDKEGQKAQGGGQWYENNPPMFSTDYGQMLPQAPNLQTQTPTVQSQYGTPTQYTNYIQGDANLDGVVNELDKPKNPYIQNSVNIMNPFGGISMDYALNFAGEGFGSGNYGKAAIGTGTALLKGTRNFLSGYSTGKENKRVQGEYMDKMFDRTPNYAYGQQGGVKNSDIIAQNAITDQGQGNVNLEGKEIVMRTNGMVQPVVGDAHIKNGKKADGVDAQLNDGDKVLSNYVKLKPTDIKELKERYDISLKRGATFAEAQKKLDQKLGIKKLETEKAGILEKIEKATKIRDTDSRQLSLEVLTKKTGDVNEKLNTLSGVRADNFEFLFQRQEAIPKKGSGTELYDKNGKEVTESKEERAQQGRTYRTNNQSYDVQKVSNVLNSGTSDDNMGINLRKIKSIQSGVVNDKLGNGYYMYYDKLPTDAGFDPNRNREFITEEAYKNTVLRTPAYQEYMRGLSLASRTNQLVELQQGGQIETLAKKHGLSLERAQELMSFQQGEVQNEQEEQGEVSQENQIQQVFQAVAEMLQQGMQPEQVAEQLIQMGVPEEQVGQLIQEVVQQLQGQSSAEESMEGQYSNEQEEGMEVAQQGGEKEYYQSGGGYSFSTRVTPELKGYDTQGTSVLNQDTLSDVEEWQPYTGKGYGAKMANIEDTIKVHNWYFDTEEKKKAFREAAVKEGKQPEVEAFQKAYNIELENRAKKAGLPETDISGIKQQVGFSDKGVQKVDGLFGAFTSTRPLYNFTKKDGVVEVKAEVTPNVQTQQAVESKNNVKNIMPNFGSYIPLFSPMQSLAKETIEIPRMDAIEKSAEEALKVNASNYATTLDRLEQSGMSPQQIAATMGSALASTQEADTRAISQVSDFNAQNQFQADNYNLGARSKEDIMNAQFRQNYQDKAMQTLANNEESIRNQYRSSFLQGEKDRQYIDQVNKANMMSDQWALVPGQGIVALNNKPFELPNNTLELLKNYDKMTPAERIAFMKSQSKLAQVN